MICRFARVSDTGRFYYPTSHISKIKEVFITMTLQSLIAKTYGRFHPGWHRLLIPCIVCMTVFPMIVPVAGATHVDNPSEPAHDQLIIRATELWRVGGEDDERFFGNIASVKSDEEGNVYLLDSQLSEVSVYSPDGIFIRTLSREGDGPGEVRRPGDMFFALDGTVGLVQTFPGKIIRVYPDGTPAGVLNYSMGDPSQGRFGVLVRGLARGNVFLLAGIRMSFGADGSSTQTYFLSRCNEDGTEIHTYASKETMVNYADFVLSEMDMDFAWGRFELDSDGLLYIAPERNEYKIYVYNPDGDLLRSFGRQYESYERKDDDLKTARETLDAVGRNYPVRPREIVVEDTEPDIGTLYARNDGTIWITTSRGDRDVPDGAMRVMDVFDSDGRFTRQAVLMLPGDALKDAFYVIGDNRAVIVKGALDAYISGQGVVGDSEDEDETVLEIICYSLTM